jgi:hypothetical protein
LSRCTTRTSWRACRGTPCSGEWGCGDAEARACSWWGPAAQCAACGWHGAQSCVQAASRPRTACAQSTTHTAPHPPTHTATAPHPPTHGH